LLNLQTEFDLRIIKRKIWSDIAHPNVEKYPNQRIITVIIYGYAHMVPYVMDGEDYFLKTIIPSRKENRKFKGEKDV